MLQSGNARRTSMPHSSCFLIVSRYFCFASMHSSTLQAQARWGCIGLPPAKLQRCSQRRATLECCGSLSRRQALGLTAGGAVAAAEAGSGRPAAASQISSASPGTATEVKPVGISPKETVELGKSGLMVTPIGIGAWSWGDNSGYWGAGQPGNQRSDNFAAYKALVDSGISLIDTAEVYGFGASEEYLSQFMRDTSTRVVVATKFAPLPWRFTRSTVVDACKKSLARLRIEKLGLYQQHWPGFITNGFSNRQFVEGLGDCHDQGLTQAIGVSNFKLNRVRDAQKILSDRGIPLASNQVQYSLLYRNPERNGVKKACEEGGTTLIAYSPLAQGLLTGKYNKDNLPSGARGIAINAQRVDEVQPLLGLMRDIGSAHGGKTPAQVAINWCICKGAVPIPGAKSARQAQESAGGFGWRMSDDQVLALERETDKISGFVGAPFENW